MPMRIEKPSVLADAPPPGAGGRLNQVVLIAAVVMGVVIIALVVALLVVVTRPPAAAPPPPPGESANPSAPTSSGQSSSSEPVEELPRSQVGIGGDNAAGTLGPLFIHYDQTPEGAAAAAMNYLVAMQDRQMYVDKQRRLIQTYVYADDATHKKWAITDEVAAKTRKRFKLNAQGQPLDTSKELYWGIYPEYGAFKIGKVRGNTEVDVTMWYPKIRGTGSTRSDLSIEWNWTQLKMVWADDDWRIKDFLDTPADTPKPAESTYMWVSYQERAELLGRGWQLTSDASVEPIERLELPEK